MLRQLAFKCKTRRRKKKCDLFPLLNTLQNDTKHIVHDLYNICSNHPTFYLQWTRIWKVHYAVYVCDTHVTLKKVVIKSVVNL